jgi:RNA polymerase sigma-70 factor, ECF subfamily
LNDADPELEALLCGVRDRDADARNRILHRYRGMLKAQVEPRLKGFLSARVDASDIVQETLTVVDDRLNQFVETRPVPFVVWIREIAMERVVDAYRFHISAQKRSVRREEVGSPLSTDDSMNALAQRFADKGSSPSQHVQKKEIRQRVRDMLQRLPELDRDVLVLRHLEHLSMREIGQVLQMTENAIKVRHLRALQRLRDQFGDQFGDKDGSFS